MVGAKKRPRGRTMTLQSLLSCRYSVSGSSPSQTLLRLWFRSVSALLRDFVSSWQNVLRVSINKKNPNLLGRDSG